MQNGNYLNSIKNSILDEIVGSLKKRINCNHKWLIINNPTPLIKIKKYLWFINIFIKHHLDLII